MIETSRSIADVSREYGLNEATVGGWVKNYRAAHAADEPPLELSDRARLRELERRNPRTRNGECIPEKSQRVLREGAAVSGKYAFIAAERAGNSSDYSDAPTIVKMCTWLGVSKSGFYDWARRPPSTGQRRRELLAEKIRALFDEFAPPTGSGASTPNCCAPASGPATSWSAS